MIHSIYKITNKINHKSYIGKTSHNPRERWNRHINGSSNCPAINSAITKYGASNFEFDILYQTKDFDHCTQMEITFIEIFHGYTVGYNCTIGGEGVVGLTFSNESKELMSISAKNRKEITEETRNKLKSHGKRGSTSYHKRYTKETRNKLRESQIKRMENGYNPKSSKWKLYNGKEIIIVNNPTIYCRENNLIFKTLWMSLKRGKPISKGKMKSWQLLEII